MDDRAKKYLLENFATPSYVFDLDRLRQQMELVKACLGEKVLPCYAMKANPFLLQPMDAYTEKYEVCSPGEYEICHGMGIAPEKIVVSGVNKTEASMKRILELSQGAGIFTIESEEQYLIFAKLCEELSLSIRVLLRLSSGNQFGMDKQTFEQVLVRVQQHPYIQLQGLHFYSGTQKKMKKIEKELDFLDAYARYIKETYGISFQELEYGPGLSVSYFQNEPPIDAKEQLLLLKQLLEKQSAYEQISIEMGRFLAGSCGFYFTKAVDVKQTEGINYAIVDGGMHQLNYYGQMLGMKLPYVQLLKANGEAAKAEATKPWNVCGSLCSVNDVILKQAEFPNIEKGDCLVFENCGAYSVTEGMALFLSRELPQILFYSQENAFTIVREMVETNKFILQGDKKWNNYWKF